MMFLINLMKSVSDKSLNWSLMSISVRFLLHIPTRAKCCRYWKRWIRISGFSGSVTAKLRLQDLTKCTMRKSQTQNIRDVIRDCLNEMRIDRKLKEVQLVSQWESLMGKTVANRTSQIYIRNRVLYIRITSPVLKNELLMMRQG